MEITQENQLESGFMISKRYEVLYLLGEGGMGSVYLARDHLLERKDIAIKILHNSLLKDKSSVRRFLREVGLTQDIHHPNVVRTYDVGSDAKSRLTYFTMEYVCGDSLENISEKRKLEYADIASIASQVCKGLSAIHQVGVVHRDLTLRNIILVNDVLAKIADFGIAHTAGSNLTRVDQIIGSPEYIAPEVWRNEGVTPATDLYSLGVGLYALASGQYPFEADSPAALLKMHLGEMPASPITVCPDVPPWLNDIIMVLLDKEPSYRPSSAEEVAGYIGAYLDNEEQVSRIAPVEPDVGISRLDTPPKTNGKHDSVRGGCLDAPKIEDTTNPPSSVSRSQPMLQKSLLLIEDCDNTREVLRMLLEKEMISLVLAKDGFEGLQKLCEFQPDAILCDLWMPVMDGREFLQKLRSDRLIRDIPVMILTANDSTENEVELLEMGARDFVCKTSDARIVLSRIRNLLQYG